MPEIEIQPGRDNERLPIERLPTGALQAIYHAVTGKTESMSKSLNGSVEIEKRDIDRLYEMLMDQMGHYSMVCKPTVTVVVKYESDKSVTYSSWERFNALQSHHAEITSEVVLKIESVIRLPDTDIDQRLVVNVLLDSSLPVIQKYRQEGDEMEGLGFFIVIKREWLTVKLTIDFVDFLVARVITGVVEEWFLGLKKTPSSRMNDLLLRHTDTIKSLLRELPRIGMAAFIASSVIFIGSGQVTLRRVLLGLALSLTIWSMLAVTSTRLGKSLHRRTSRNVVPTVIVLTDGDDRAYSDIKTKGTSPLSTLAILIGTAVFNIGINILSSYLYSGGE